MRHPDPDPEQHKGQSPSGSNIYQTATLVSHSSPQNQQQAHKVLVSLAGWGKREVRW